jgi:phenylacetate-coenzyme A ligase PaaK-like adenylate-forming protein
MTEHVIGLIWDAWRTKKKGANAIAQRQRARLADMVAHARARSPYYRELYRDLPEKVQNIEQLPMTDKKTLMGSFDDWVTDGEVTLEKVRGLVADPDRVGERFVGRYTVASTSGTTGRPGLFLTDDRTMAVVSAMALRTLTTWLGFDDFVRLVRGGGRAAFNEAPGHTPTGVSAARSRRSARGRKRILPMPVHTPVAELVSRLNAFRPAILASYASTSKLLAIEQKAGRLNIRPVLVVSFAEELSVDDYDHIAEAFDAKVGNTYAASECQFLSYSCEHKWLHVNADWVILEPVDADYRPVLPGKHSHTVLLTNLANRVQPILRYDLGDSILQRPDPCPCGNPLPAIRVHGRSSEVLTFPTPGGGQVTIPPLAFEIDHLPGLALSQIVQTEPARLRVRLLIDVGADPDTVWEKAHAELKRVLADHGLNHVAVERAEEPPEQTKGGKFRQVIPLSDAPPPAANSRRLP